MATWLEDIITAFENLGGRARYFDLYPEVERIRTEPLPESWQAIIRRQIETYSSDSDSFLDDPDKDLFYTVEGIGSGVWGLRRSLETTPNAVDIEEPGLPGRSLMKTYRVLRDTALARTLKKLHEDQCQICGETLRLRNGETYSEAHHIQPLGKDHNGPDIEENIIILCPNHHVLCDYRSIPLDLEKIRTVDGHSIGAQFIEYHNNNLLPSFD